MKLKDRIKLLKDSDVQWDFDGKPRFELRGLTQHGSSITVDPFPCYSHSKSLVTQMAKLVESKFPIQFKPVYYILPLEAESRVNGTAFRNSVWNNDKFPKIKESYPFDPFICLSGKRIQPHPCMTRYLVVHEVGHLIQNWIEYKCGIKDDETTDFDREYAKMRRIKLNNKYGARKHNSNIGEVIANDFRIAVCDVEPEFWAHSCSHPYKNPTVINFWKEMVKKYAFK